MRNLKIVQIILIAIIADLLLSFKLTWSCDSKIYCVAQKDWSRDRYKLYLFYETNSPESEPILKLLEQKKKDWWPRANIRIFSIDIRKIEDKYKTIVEKYPPNKIPEIIVLSPNEELITRINNPINPAMLDGIISSHKRKEIVQHLNDKGTLFLCLINKNDKKKNSEILQIAKNTAKIAMTMFNQEIPILEVDKDNPHEEILIKNIELISRHNQPSVFLVFGKGKLIGNATVLTSQERLLDQVQLINHNCACTINPIEFGTDLLLTWE